MLEESFKAIESPVAARLSLSRSASPADEPFSALNRAGLSTQCCGRCGGPLHRHWILGFRV